MIDRDHRLRLTRQAKSLGITRGRNCDGPRPVSDADLSFAIVARTDGAPWLIALDL